jgi:hypothetical protein
MEQTLGTLQKWGTIQDGGFSKIVVIQQNQIYSFCKRFFTTTDFSLFQNSPIYIATQDLDKELELSYRVHAALDVIDEKCSQKQAAVDSRDLFLGQLYSTEMYKM